MRDVDRALARYEYASLNQYGSASEEPQSREPNWKQETGWTVDRGQLRVSEYLPSSEYTRILNLGGSWQEAQVYSEMGYDCTTVVLSEALAAVFQEDGLKVIRNDMCDLSDVDNSSWDGLVSVQALEHVFYPWKALLEIQRVVRNGGRIMIDVPVWRKEHEQMDVPDYMDSGNLQHCSILQPYQFRFMIRQVGFLVLEHDTHFNRHTIYAEKLSYEQLRGWDKDSPLSMYYNAKTAEFLAGYCQI